MFAFNPHALLTSAQMGRVDAAAIQAGVPGPVLMDTAGRAVADTVIRHWSRRPVHILCGPGNNGGDGFVAARYLRNYGWPVRVALLGDSSRLSADAAYHLAALGDAPEPFSPQFLESAGLVIDAIFGAGLARAVDGTAKTMLQEVARLGLPVCAVDVPSGVDGSSGQVLGYALQAQHTVTFVRKKPAHVLLPGRHLCGQVHLADIGVPAGVLKQQVAVALENHPCHWLSGFPWPQAGAHKYARGHVLVAGGALMTGAARLSALAAARAGAGLVTVAAPAAAWPVYAASLLSVMVQPVNSLADWRALVADERKNAILLGPGAGADGVLRQQVLVALKAGRRVVLDADALSAFAQCPQTLFDAICSPCVLTPHEGEFARLFPGLADQRVGKIERASQAASLSGAVVVLKGADTVVAGPDGTVIVNTNAPSTLATAGTGDVLAGLIAGLLAQGLSSIKAAAAAVWMHGEAARLFGPGLLADDLPACLPQVLRSLAPLGNNPFRAQ